MDGLTHRTHTEVIEIREVGHVANLYVRQLHFASAGLVMTGHSHQFEHLSLLSAGAITLRWRDADGWHTRDYTAPACIPMPAHVHHEVTALEDGTDCWCIFAVRDLDGRVLSMTEATDGRPVTGF